MAASFVIDDGGFIIIGSSSSKIEYSNTSRDYKRENFSEPMVSYYGPMGNRGLILVSAWWFLEQDFLSLFLFVLFFPGIPFLHSFFFLVTSLVHHPFPDHFYFTSILLSHHSPSSRSNIHMCLMQMYDKWHCMALSFGYCTRLLGIIFSERWVCEELCTRAYACRFLYQSAFINYKCTIRLKQNKVQRDMPTIKCLQLKIQIRLPFLPSRCFNKKKERERERERLLK